MQYPNYYGYQPQYTPPMNQQGGINWCQGEAGAKSFMVAAGNSVLLMDSENTCFYIKSTDQSGMPLPLRIFDYTERTAEQGKVIASPEYVTRAEFNSLVERLNAITEVSHEQSTI